MKYLLIALVLVGCVTDPNVYQQSTAPPGRSARLDEVNSKFWGILQYYRLEVSNGVAVALTCQNGGPCEKANIVSEDPSIAEVRLASLAALEHTGGYMSNNQTPTSAFVVIGKTPGKTTLHIKEGGGHRKIVVTVVAPPTANPQTQAITAAVK